MNKRKKLQVWLSPMEFQTLSDYCERNGVSFYSVLKEGINRIVLGRVDQGEFPITPKQDSGLVAPPVKAAQAGSPELEEWKRTMERGQDNLRKEVEKLADHERLWQEMGELKAGFGELRGLVSGLLLKLTKTEELENKIDEKMENTVAGVLERLGLKERV